MALPPSVWGLQTARTRPRRWEEGGERKEGCWEGLKSLLCRAGNAAACTGLQPPLPPPPSYAHLQFAIADLLDQLLRSGLVDTDALVLTKPQWQQLRASQALQVWFWVYLWVCGARKLHSAHPTLMCTSKCADCLLSRHAVFAGASPPSQRRRRGTSGWPPARPEAPGTWRSVESYSGSCL